MIIPVIYHPHYLFCFVCINKKVKKDKSKIQIWKYKSLFFNEITAFNKSDILTVTLNSRTICMFTRERHLDKMSYRAP